MFQTSLQIKDPTSYKHVTDLNVQRSLNLIPDRKSRQCTRLSVIKFNHQTLIPLIFKTDALDLIGPSSHMTKPSLDNSKVGHMTPKHYIYCSSLWRDM